MDQHSDQISSINKILGFLKRFLPTPGNALFTLLLVSGLFWASSVGAVPSFQQASSNSTVAYQGRLADAGGTPVTATVPMVFRLYNVGEGGAPLWTENWTGSNSVRVSDGLFNVMLGSLTQIPQNIVTGNSNLWLGITVNADNEMQPRVQLGTVPFAIQALTVPDGSITAAKLAPNISFAPPDGSITTAKIADAAVTTAKIADGAITAAKVADGTLTNRKMRMIYGSAGGGALALTTTPQTLPNSQTQFVVDVPSVIQIQAVFDAITPGAGSTVIGHIVLDGTPVGRQAILGNTNTRATVATIFSINVEPGTHTIAIAAYANTAGAQIGDHSGYNYLVLAR